MHRRQALRDALVAQLSGLSLTADRVYPMRTRALGDDDLPAIRIYTPSERQVREDGGGVLSGEQFHRVEVRIEVVAKASDEVEQILDGVCEEVEDRLDFDPTLGGAVQWITYQSTEVDYQDDDETVMQATLVYEAEIVTE